MSKLQIFDRPVLKTPALIMGFSGWMDSGEVSTGTLNWLIERLNAKRFAHISPEGFYIYNFPGALEWASMFRPHALINDGLVESFGFPSNDFYYSTEQNIILFLGKEPNLRWEEYADYFFTLTSMFQVNMIYFVGSVSSLVPHTREPRLMCVTSNALLKEQFRHFGVKFTNYEGPASMATYLCTRCTELQQDMVNLIAATPAYVQGNNPKCIEAMLRRVAGMMDLNIDLSQVKHLTDEFERKLNELIEAQPDLASNIVRLEEDYDNDIFDNEMGDLKQWLEQQGIRLD
ncbi:MAG: PAC2 family protein [Phycisphaerae bacterium]|nr:PAC2 family protein [Phycisphaerae bacterium]